MTVTVCLTTQSFQRFDDSEWQILQMWPNLRNEPRNWLKELRKKAENLWTMSSQRFETGISETQFRSWVAKVFILHSMLGASSKPNRWHRAVAAERTALLAECFPVLARHTANGHVYPGWRQLFPWRSSPFTEPCCSAVFTHTRYKKHQHSLDVINMQFIM
jgi:hypothetical protein